MVLATRTSAPNTSLAVIRPKPRPDSPTASEISVIMLKSELPHEASNPVSKKEARVHHTAWRCSGVATRGTRAAAEDAAARICRHSAPGRADLHQLSQADGRTRLPRRPQLHLRLHPDAECRRLRKTLSHARGAQGRHVPGRRQ